MTTREEVQNILAKLPLMEEASALRYGAPGGEVVRVWHRDDGDIELTGKGTSDEALDVVESLLADIVKGWHQEIESSPRHPGSPYRYLKVQVWPRQGTCYIWTFLRLDIDSFVWYGNVLYD